MKKKINQETTLKYFHNHSIYSFSNESVVFSSIKNKKNKYIKLIQLNDFSKLQLLNSNSKEFIFDSITRLMLNIDFSFIKIKLKANNSTIKYENIIKDINTDLNVKKTNWILQLNKKLLALNFIKNELNNDDYENNFFLLISHDQENILNDQILKIENLLNKFSFNFTCLKSIEAFDILKKIHNKDEIDSSVLFVDSRIPHENIFNIKKIEEKDNYLILNNNQYINILKIQQNEFNHDFFKSVFTENNINLIINFKNGIYETLIYTHENNWETFDYQINKLKQLMTNFNNMSICKNINQFKYYSDLFNLNTLINSTNLTHDSYLKLYNLFSTNPFVAASLSKEGLFLGFNMLEQKMFISDTNCFNVLNIGNNDLLSIKWMNYNFINNKKIIILDYSNKLINFFDFPKKDIKINRSINVNIFSLNIKKDDFFQFEKIKNKKIEYLIQIFSIINSNIENLEIKYMIKEFLNNFYNKWFNKIKRSKKDFLQLNVNDFINSVKLIKTKSIKFILKNIVDVFINNESIMKVISNDNQTDNSDIEQINFINMSWINEEPLLIQNIINFIILDKIYFLILKEGASLYANNINKIISNDILSIKFNEFLKTNKHNNCFFDLENIEILSSDFLNYINYININPQNLRTLETWINILNKIDINFESEDYEKLNSINNSLSLLITNSNKYWYKLKIDDWEKQMKFEFNEHELQIKTNELENEIYYSIERRKNKTKEFILHNVFNQELQEKIWNENWDYLKKLKSIK